MITVNFTTTPDAPYFLVPDHEIEEKIKDLISLDNVYVAIGSEVIFDGFRVFIAEGKIDPSEIRLQFEGQDLECTNTGELKHWPKGLCDVHLDFSFRILKARMGKAGKDETKQIERDNVECGEDG